MDKKPFENVLTFIDQIYYDNNGFQNNNDTLEILFNGYNYNERYLNVEDFLLEKTEIEKYRKYDLLINSFKNINENMRLNLVVAFYNLLYFSDASVSIKNKFANFLQRYQIILNDDLEYKYPINITNNNVLYGSFAAVYLLNDNMVRKQLKLEYWDNKDIKSYFKNEYKIQNRLKSLGAQVLEVFDFDEVQNSFLMERGECDLYDYIDSHILTSDEKYEFINQLLNVVGIAHNNEIIHRDIHPGNIMIKDGKIYLNDFGFAKDSKFSRSKLTTATPKQNHRFLAPEGFRNFLELDKFSDIYSLGKVIDFIMSDGNFEGNHVLKTVVGKSTLPNKEQRYDSIESLIRNLKDVIDLYDSNDGINSVIDNIDKGIYNEAVEQFIINLANKNELASFMVSRKSTLDNIFSKIINETEKLIIVESVFQNYASATGYGGWSNYDIFGIFAYNIIINESNLSLRKRAFLLLKECSTKRYQMKNLLDNISPEIKELLDNN